MSTTVAGTPAPVTAPPARAGERRRAAAALSWVLAAKERRPIAFRLAATVVLTAIALVVVDHSSPDTNNLIAQAACFSIVILGLSFLTGFSGQVSLGNGAFMAVGCYAVGIWSQHHGRSNMVVLLVVATAAGALAGLAVGLPATRLRGPYLAGLTIAVSLALPSIIDQFGSWTQAGQGISIAPLTSPAWLHHYLGISAFSADQVWQTAIAVVTTAIAFFFMGNLFRSRVGRGMRLMRENDVAAELTGVALARHRVVAFVVSSACAGLGGGLLALVTSVIQPSFFSLALSIELLVLLVIGGIGTLSGALIGGVLFAYSNQWIQSLVNVTGLNPQSNLATSLNGIIFGGVLILFVLVLPLGIAGTPRFAIHRWRRNRARPTEAAPAD